jgi:uncharacterized protein YaiI (UPF0178 family)
MPYSTKHNPFACQIGEIYKILSPQEIGKGWFRLVFLVRTEVEPETTDHPTLAESDRVLMYAVFNESIDDFYKRFKLGDKVIVLADIKNANYWHDEKMDYFHEKGQIYNAYNIRKIDDETGKKISKTKHRKMLEEMKGS